jgi:hypothetical protein
MAEIEIILSVDIDETETPISFLSIPRSDIERLAVFPFRWIRYVMFAICGAQGDLSTTPNGTAVDYEKTEIANDENIYYYRPSGKLSFCHLCVRLLFQCLDFPGPCAYVDYEGLNDRITTSDGTQVIQRDDDFRKDVIRRDGPACVITRREQAHCDAAHLIPHSKGDEVRFVVRSYNHLMTLFSSTLKK